MTELLIIFLTAIAISAAGFIMYVYFFSVGYGFSIAGIGIALLALFHSEQSIGTILMCALFIIYGARLGGYLLYRELKSTAYKSLLENESKSNVPLGVKCCIWVSCALLYTCQTSPVLFRLQNGSKDDIFLMVGTVLAAAGILLEIAADWQKSQVKKTDPGKFVTSGLYRFVRCPNYFGELLLWVGVFVSGINVYRTPFQWILAIIGLVGITYVMFSGARRLELRQDRNYGTNEIYQNYVKTTPILIPLVPIYSVKQYKWLVA